MVRSYRLRTKPAGGVTVANESTDWSHAVANGYVMLLLDVHDADRYRRYLDEATPTVVAQGGRFLVASDTPDVAEGTWPASRTIVIEFASVAAAQAWYTSASYAPLVAARQGAAESQVAIFEGA